MHSVKGIVKNPSGVPLPQVKVYLSTSTGVPYKHNGNVIGAITDFDGKYTLNLPTTTQGGTERLLAEYLTASDPLYPKKLQKVYLSSKNYNFSFGSGVQEYEPIKVIGKKKTTPVPTPKQKKPWNWLLIIGGSLLLITTTIVVVKKIKNK